MNNIHKSAIISKNAVIGDNVTIGAFSVIGDNVKIANNNTIHSSVCIDGFTDIGESNQFFSFCSIGSIPQDLKYRGENSKLIIGKNNTFSPRMKLGNTPVNSSSPQAFSSNMPQNQR